MSSEGAGGTRGELGWSVCELLMLAGLLAVSAEPFQLVCLHRPFPARPPSSCPVLTECLCMWLPLLLLSRAPPTPNLDPDPDRRSRPSLAPARRRLLAAWWTAAS